VRGGGASGLPLRATLARVSRSFYLSLRLLPKETREPVGLAYLLARASDTVADTAIVPRADRLRLLDGLAAAFAGRGDPGPVTAELARWAGRGDVLPAERTLLAELPGLLAALDRAPEPAAGLTRTVLHTITAGQRDDLERAPAGRDDVVALGARAELDRYCYQVAGCVGEFWSDLHAARLRGVPRGADLAEWRGWGVRLGRTLQLTNVLRDAAEDAANGRAYLPAADLAGVGLEPAALRDPGAWPRLRPLYRELIGSALADGAAGLRYGLAIPARRPGLRMASLLPLLLAVPTLGRVWAGNPLDPRARAKVPRRQVYATLAALTAAVREDRRLVALYRRTLARAGLEELAPPSP